MFKKRIGWHQETLAYVAYIFDWQPISANIHFPLAANFGWDANFGWQLLLADNHFFPLAATFGWQTHLAVRYFRMKATFFFLADFFWLAAILDWKPLLAGINLTEITQSFICDKSV